MALSFSKYLRLVFIKAFEDFGFVRDMLLGTGIAIVTAILGALLHLSTAEDWTRHRKPLIVSLAAPYAVVLLAHVGWRITRAPWKVYQDQERELRELQQQSMKSGELSEYDPKVYLDPLNEEFRATGLIPFELSNKGQRVNVAHRITVQPILAIPAVTFEYVDHLDMAQRKTIMPTIDTNNLFARKNILAELNRAWEEACKAKQQLEVDFPFEIKLTYEDVSRTKKFETTVQLTYYPMEENAARRSAIPGASPEHVIIKVNDTIVRRLL